jgi:hypothetical protein
MFHVQCCLGTSGLWRVALLKHACACVWLNTDFISSVTTRSGAEGSGNYLTASGSPAVLQRGCAICDLPDRQEGSCFCASLVTFVTVHPFSCGHPSGCEVVFVNIQS